MHMNHAMSSCSLWHDVSLTCRHPLLFVSSMANDENKIYSIMQLGGVKLLISIIEQHVEDENVVCAALGALTKMVTRKENAIFIVKSGGIQAAHAALNEHPKSERVAKQVLDFFQRIAAHEECVPMLVANGVIKDVIEILKNHGKNPEVSQHCNCTSACVRVMQSSCHACLSVSHVSCCLFCVDRSCLYQHSRSYGYLCREHATHHRCRWSTSIGQRVARSKR